jgi:hypothetical protein
MWGGGGEVHVHIYPYISSVLGEGGSTCPYLFIFNNKKISLKQGRWDINLCPHFFFINLFTRITKAVSSNPTQVIQHYVVKFVRDLWQVCAFSCVLWFPPPIKLTTTISLKVALNTITLTLTIPTFSVQFHNRV